MSESGFYEVRTDGGARGNPGPAAIGYVVSDPGGDLVAEEGRCIGITTNNVAEYQAVIAGLQAASDAGAGAVRLLSDSQLVVRQLEGIYRVKDAKLQPLHATALGLLDGFDETDVLHVRREENHAADALVNQALDAEAGVTVDGRDVSSVPAEDGCGTWELTVKGHFDAAHELLGYPGQCKDLHGHTWDVEVTIAGEDLDEIGIVYDFSLLKHDLATVLEPYDHAHLNEVAPFDTLNPTAENLARVICEAMQARLGSEIRVVEVAVWESPIARIVYRPR